MELRSSSSLRWYVVQSKPREELRAGYFLKEKGLEVYVPLMEVAITRGSHSVMQRKPLFPSYLFCRFDPEISLGHVRWTKGVVKILPESINPISVENHLVTSLLNLGQKDGIIRKRTLKKNFLI